MFHFPKKSFFISCFLLLSSSFYWASCSKEADPSPVVSTPVSTIPSINTHVWERMKQNYLWNKEMPTQIDLKNFPNVAKLVDSLRYKRLDRWTYIVNDNGNAYNQVVQGTSQGVFGWSLAWNESDKSLRVRFVQPNGTPAEAGMKRGDKLLKVNGVSLTYGQSITFTDVSTVEFEDTEGKVRTVSVSRKTLQTSAVLHQEVKNINGRKVAYLVFNEFTTPAVAELNKAIEFFRAEKATDLILDLRYNGGGLVTTTQHLANLIAPENAIGRVFFKIEYNSNNTNKNASIPFERFANAYRFTNIVILQTLNTASASELIINGLRPFTNMKLVGTNSHGKFCGGGIEIKEGYTFSPIEFRMTNSVGVSDYANGFAPDLRATDDLRYAFGDLREDMLRKGFEALNINLPSTGGRVEKTPISESRKAYSEQNENGFMIF